MGESVKVRIGSQLRARVEPGSDLDQQICEYLTIANQAKVAAVRRGDWGADEMPDAIELWQRSGDELIMPRGFAAVLRAGIENRGMSVEWEDETVAPSIAIRTALELPRIELYDYQVPAVQSLLDHRQGVLQARTGSGKTIMGLEAWRRTGVTGLVCVNNIGLAQQWQDRAREHLGVETGLIGDGVWDEQPLTIAMMQTLYRSERARRGADFWRRWGMTIIDEAHHAIAPTFREIIERALSRILAGKTATPLEGDWRQPILLNLLGPIIHAVKTQGVVPTVRVIKTGFQWKPKGREIGLVDARAIYRHVIKALEDDPMRMGLIVTTIMGQPRECAQLVLCKRLPYIERMHMRLGQAGYPRERIFFYRGAESREERRRVAAEACEGHCVILATAADEGTDIPRLDRLHLTWPARRRLTIEQQVGRVMREHPDKDETIIFDYADFGNSMLRAQFYARVNEVYRRRDWPIEFIDTARSTA